MNEDEDLGIGAVAEARSAPLVYRKSLLGETLEYFHHRHRSPSLYNAFNTTKIDGNDENNDDDVKNEGGGDDEGKESGVVVSGDKDEEVLSEEEKEAILRSFRPPAALDERLDSGRRLLPKVLMGRAVMILRVDASACHGKRYVQKLPLKACLSREAILTATRRLLGCGSNFLEYVSLSWKDGGDTVHWKAWEDLEAKLTLEVQNLRIRRSRKELFAPYIQEQEQALLLGLSMYGGNSYNETPRLSSLRCEFCLRIIKRQQEALKSGLLVGLGRCVADLSHEEQNAQELAARITEIGSSEGGKEAMATHNREAYAHASQAKRARKKAVRQLRARDAARRRKHLDEERALQVQLPPPTPVTKVEAARSRRAAFLNEFNRQRDQVRRSKVAVALVAALAAADLMCTVKAEVGSIKDTEDGEEEKEEDEDEEEEEEEEDEEEEEEDAPNDDDDDDDDDDDADDKDANVDKDIEADTKGRISNLRAKKVDVKFRRCIGCLEEIEGPTKSSLAVLTPLPLPLSSSSSSKRDPEMLSRALESTLHASDSLKVLRAARKEWSKYDLSVGFPLMSLESVNRGFENGVRGNVHNNCLLFLLMHIST